jgi:heavy metal sensor kinase
MKSIRLSLMLYFLVLLGLALGAVAVSAYQYTQYTLEAKVETRRELLKTYYERDCERERQNLDDALRQRARTLADQALFQYQWSRTRVLDMAPLGLLSMVADPNGYLLTTRCILATLWLPERHHRGPLFDSFHRQFAAEIQIQEDALTPFGDGQIAEYFQINTERGRPWRSRSLADRSFAFDANAFLTIPTFDDAVIDGVPVRRVRLKAPVSRFLVNPRPLGGRGLAGQRPNNGENRAGSALDAPRRPPTPLLEPNERPAPVERPAQAIFVQCAAETTQREAALALLRQDYEKQLAALAADSNATLATLRNLLLAIGLATFAATVIGGFWLVRLGLSPLQRLSEAVSRVSPKDFRLPFDEPRLPQELKPIVERLTQTLELLKRTFAREKQAAADISHELRTPLAALLTTIEVSLRKPRSSQEYCEVLAECHATGQQMSQLVERLLVLARLDAGVDILRPREVDVANLTEQCAILVRPLAEARGLTVRFHRNGPVPVKADPDKLREVLTNLLHNAIEYNRPKGSVDVSLERENGQVRLEVRDTGIGIAPEARDHIFERFYRADPSRRAEGLHAGLGLAIVKGYVDLMGGTITVESTPGQGSSFRLQLPVQEVAGGQRSLSGS